MRHVMAMLRDPKRSQRGSVLSGVLIMVLFLAIISGALVTELSTQFLVSRTLVNRVGNEATVNSAVELALDQLQNHPLITGCPPLSPITLNGRTASVSYVSCFPVVDVRSAQFTSVATSAPFNIEATHSVVSSSQDLYLVGDSGGNIYQFQFGATLENWSMALGTSITGPPMAMQDAAASPPDPTDITNLVPIAGGGSSGCPANACVELLAQDSGHPPDHFCYMAANASVTSRPAAGVAFPQVAYFGDTGGTLHANTATEFSCAPQAVATNAASAAIVAGPVVLQNGARDEIYVVTSKASTAQLLRYEYQQSPVSLTLKDTLTLPFSNPVGLASENVVVAPRIAITFAGGGVAVYNTNTSFDPSLAASKTLGAGISNAPYLCSCPGGAQIGIAGLNGTLYVLATNLNLVASYAGGSPIRTTPASDAVGEWFFGADDGYIHELQLTVGQPSLTQTAQYGQFGGRVASSAIVGACPSGICIYAGDMDSNAYLVQLDARDATITACLSDTPPACSGLNPRLWMQVEQGSASGPNTVRIGGWSYYSP